MAGTIAEMFTAPAEKEADEPEIEAEPRLDRSTFLYLEGRKGIDGEGYFGCCASCENFIPESQMRGAVRGDRCKLLGAQFPINDDSGCNFYAPWPTGRPCDGCLAHHAEKMIRGERGSVMPMAAGFVFGQRRVCTTCRQYDFEAKECRFFEELNEKLPALFDLNKAIVTPAKCTAWTAPAENDG